MQLRHIVIPGGTRFQCNWSTEIVIPLLSGLRSESSVDKVMVRTRHKRTQLRELRSVCVSLAIVTDLAPYAVQIALAVC